MGMKEIDGNIGIVGDFNIPLSTMNRETRLKINKKKNLLTKRNAAVTWK